MNRSRTRPPLLMAAVVALAACAESTAPAGTPSTVTVRAYVDSDGSGGFSAGDVGVGGASIHLESADGRWTGQAPTDPLGVATIADVPPGSYHARFVGPAPAGAMLATATEPVIATRYQGGTVAAEFRFVYNPGRITGVLFRDDNGNGQYDEGIDTPAPGIPVRLVRGSGAEADTLASVTTSGTGAYTFETLRPGAYTLVFSPLPTMQLVGGNTVAVQVEPAAETTAATRFTGQLIITIAAARQAPAASIVAVEGVVTAGVGVFSTNATSNQFNVQDPTGGVLVLQIPLASGIQQGDSVRIIGTTAVSAGELVLTQNPTVTVLASSRPLPSPRTITAGQVAASNAADPLQGQLVRVEDVRLDSLGTGATAYNAFVTGTSGGSFIVRVGTAAVGVPRDAWDVGRVYNVTGPLANFNGAQVKVRSAADVTGGTQVLTIAQARTKALNDTVVVEGVITVRPGMLRTQGDNLYVQDPTGGIQVFNVPAGLGLELGDVIRVSGLMGAFSGEQQVVRFSTTVPPTITKRGTAAVPAPTLVTPADVADHSFEGRLVRLESLRVTAVGTPSAAGAYTVTTEPAGGGTFQIRIESSAVGIDAAFWVVGDSYDVTGVMSRFNATPQLKPRQAADAVRR